MTATFFQVFALILLEASLSPSVSNDCSLTWSGGGDLNYSKTPTSRKRFPVNYCYKEYHIRCSKGLRSGSDNRSFFQKGHVKTFTHLCNFIQNFAFIYFFFLIFKREKRNGIMPSCAIEFSIIPQIVFLILVRIMFTLKIIRGFIQEEVSRIRLRDTPEKWKSQKYTFTITYFERV